MHYINLAFLFLKQFVTYFEYYVKFTSYFEIIILLLIVLSAIFIIRYIKKQPSKEPLVDQIMWYRFTYNLERYYSIFVVLNSVIIYIMLLFYLRYLGIGKTVNLAEIGSSLKTFLFQTPFLVSITLLILILALFYLLFILLFGIIRSYINQEAIKLHFYYNDHPFYEKTYFYLVDFAGKISQTIYSFYFYCNSYIALGYNVPASRFSTREEHNLEENTWLYKNVDPYYFIVFFENLHYILLVCTLAYDVYFNNFIIQYTFNILPYLFIYQLYVMLRKYLKGIALTDICSDTNIHFYHSIIYLDDRGKYAIIDGELSSPPVNWSERFMKYKASGFTKIC